MFDSDNPFQERNWKQFWVKGKKVIETQRIEDETGRREFIILAKCATCSRVLHNVEEIHAVCWICEAELCEHHTTECDVCGQIVCREHSLRIKNHFACTTHSLFETAAALLKA